MDTYLVCVRPPFDASSASIKAEILSIPGVVSKEERTKVPRPYLFEIEVPTEEALSKVRSIEGVLVSKLRVYKLC